MMPRKEVLADGVEIWLGDCRDALPLIDRVDGVITDPPYSSGARTDSERQVRGATARTVRKKGRPKQWIGATGETVYKSDDGGPRLMRSVLQVRSEHGRAVHPTQKPTGLVEPLLRYACPVGGHVLDPFGGSGTTAIVAKQCGMNATLIEADPEYQDVCQERIRADLPMFAEVEGA